MFILRIKSHSLKIAAFSIALVILNVANLNYIIKNDQLDIFDNSAVEMAAAGEAAPDIEGADLKALDGKIVAIDPGHGGIDDGAKRHGYEEKDINLKIASKLAAILRLNGALPVLTRESDLDYYTRGAGGKRNDLLRRSEIIQASGADVFVSIHCNAVQGSAWSGAQVFYNAKLPENKFLAETIQQALKKFPPGNKRQAKEDSKILLLKSLNIPGVLIETGFLSNKKEAGFLAEEEYQEELAKFVAKGLAYHFRHNGVR